MLTSEFNLLSHLNLVANAIAFLEIHKDFSQREDLVQVQSQLTHALKVWSHHIVTSVSLMHNSEELPIISVKDKVFLTKEVLSNLRFALETLHKNRQFISDDFVNTIEQAETAFLDYLTYYEEIILHFSEDRNFLFKMSCFTDFMDS